MALENIALDDARSVSSSVKFGNSGILKAARVRKLITVKVVLTGVLMVPGLTRNLVSEGRLDDKGCSIHTQQGTKTEWKILFSGNQGRWFACLGAKYFCVKFPC